MPGWFNETDVSTLPVYVRVHSVTRLDAITRFVQGMDAQKLTWKTNRSLLCSILRMPFMR